MMPEHDAQTDSHTLAVGRSDRHDPAALPEAVAGGTVTAPRPVTPALLRTWPLPSPGGSKYDRGHVMVVGGARATPGAVMLAGTAALRMGAGKLGLAVARSVAGHVAVAVPESGVFGLDEDADGSVTGHGIDDSLGAQVSRADAVLIGPGLDAIDGSERLLEEIVPLLPDSACIVLDAFGATALPRLDPRVLEALAGRLVLSPNPRELAYLLDRDDAGEHLGAAVLECAERYGAAVGCGTLVAWEGALWEITTGDTGLGTSGSGDVVAGAMTGLLSRGASPVQALVWAKHVHAQAGEELAARFGRVGYLAGELGAQLPRVMATLGGD